MHGGLTAAHAGVGQLLLLQRDATGAHAGLLLDLVLADIYLENAKLVCVGMRKNFLDLTHNDLIKTLCQRLCALYLNGRHGEIVGESGKIHIIGELYVILDPIQ